MPPRPTGNVQPHTVRRFRLQNIKRDAVVLIIGKRRSGKSTLMREIMYHHRDLPLGIVMSGSEESNEFYESFIPPVFVYENFSEDALQSLMDVQKRRVLESKQNGKDAAAFCIIDDFGYAKKVFTSQLFRELAMNGRHRKLFTGITLQFALDMQPGLRNQVDVVIAYADNVLANRKRLYDHFFGVYATFAEFDAVFRAATANYGCLVLDNTVKSSCSPEDCVFWFRAQKPETLPKFMVGCRAFQNYHYNRYDPNHAVRKRNLCVDDDQEQDKKKQRRQRGGGNRGAPPPEQWDMGEPVTLLEEQITAEQGPLPTAAPTNGAA